MGKYYDKSKLEKLRKQKLNIYYGKKVTNKFRRKELLKYYILGLFILADIILLGILLATELYFK